MQDVTVVRSRASVQLEFLALDKYEYLSTCTKPVHIYFGLKAVECGLFDLDLALTKQLYYDWVPFHPEFKSNLEKRS